MAGAHEPGLQQRVVGGQRKERQADRHREEAEQPEFGAGTWRLAPALRDRQRQAEGRHHQQHHVHHHRQHPAARLGQPVRIGVAEQQHGLEEHHRHRPDGRGAAKLRQHHAGEHRLHPEQQQSAEKHSGRVNDEDAGAGRPGSHGVTGSGHGCPDGGCRRDRLTPGAAGFIVDLHACRTAAAGYRAHPPRMQAMRFPALRRPARSRK